MSFRRNDQFRPGVRQLLPDPCRRFSIGNEKVNFRELSQVRQCRAGHFVVRCHHNDPVRCGHCGELDIALVLPLDITAAFSDTADSDEGNGSAESLKRLKGHRCNKRLAILQELPTEAYCSSGWQLARSIDGRQRVRNDGTEEARRQRVCDLVGRSASIQQNHVSIREEAYARRRDAPLTCRVLTGTSSEERTVPAHMSRADNAMHNTGVTSFSDSLSVTTNGHVRDAKLLGKVDGSDEAMMLELIDDGSLPHAQLGGLTHVDTSLVKVCTTLESRLIALRAPRRARRVDLAPRTTPPPAPCESTECHPATSLG